MGNKKFKAIQELRAIGWKKTDLNDCKGVALAKSNLNVEESLQGNK